MKCQVCKRDNPAGKGINENGVCETCGADLSIEYAEVLTDLVAYCETREQRQAMKAMIKVYENRWKRNRFVRTNAAPIETALSRLMMDLNEAYY